MELGSRGSPCIPGRPLFRPESFRGVREGPSRCRGFPSGVTPREPPFFVSGTSLGAAFRGFFFVGLLAFASRGAREAFIPQHPRE